MKQKGCKIKPEWMQTMIARNRKTLVVCRKYHVQIHNGKPIAE
ncbi:hypothetical protein [Laceyella putida]|uniref:AI2M/AI1M-like HNH endonuclease domain-containing protein n=1 Tax=Laceyella putida TaxID=110101 RepID=A0ABW2RNV6_9BACL